MKAEREDSHRPAAGVVAGIGNVLAVRGNPEAGKSVEGIVGFQHALEAVAQLSIPDEIAETSSGQIIAMSGRECVHDVGHSEGVIRAVPSTSAHDSARRGGSIDLREGIGFGATIVPIEAAENARRAEEERLEYERKLDRDARYAARKERKKKAKSPFERYR